MIECQIAPTSVAHSAAILEGPNVAGSNSSDLLPPAEGPQAQRAYIRRTIDIIENHTGVRSIGWSSSSVYPNADTYAATAAESILYSLDGMDSDVISRLETPSGVLWLLPYPPSVVDMGQYPSRFQGSERPRASVARLCRRACTRKRRPR
jgi:hypothetical protein